MPYEETLARIIRLGLKAEKQNQRKKKKAGNLTWLEATHRYRKIITIEGKQRAIYVKTPEEVAEKIDELQKEATAGLVVGDSTTFPEYAKRWFEYKKTGIKENTTDTTYLSNLNSHILPYFENIKLKDIRPSVIKGFMASISNMSYSAQSKNLMIINQIMSNAEADGLILKNPCKGIKAQGKRSASKEPLTQEQCQRFLNASTGTSLNSFILLRLYAGLCREEALGLKWERVHLDDVPHIEILGTTIFSRGNSLYSDSLKTAAARRVIPLPAPLRDELKKVEDKTGFVVPSVKDTEKPMPEATYKRAFNRINSQLDFKVHAHLLRHTYISNLCASGLDIKKIQYLAGHEDPQITLKIYAHVINNTPEELIKTIDEAFKNQSTGVNLGGKE
ncbi:MAG: site-specific integrase [Oscillospiraceae bacterium]|nr:site-specific integrase [Oscillospiraceae bacterium]